jgi:hypothetical protein
MCTLLLINFINFYNFSKMCCHFYSFVKLYNFHKKEGIPTFEYFQNVNLTFIFVGLYGPPSFFPMTKPLKVVFLKL